MNRLLDIGFQPCGHWMLQEDRPLFELLKFRTQKNILYAFVCDGEVMYVGKTIQALASRMAGYRNPAPSQTTNVRNNGRIRELLGNGAAVDIYALPDNGLHRYGGFHLNLAAGLEDDIIHTLRPPWNAGRPEQIQASDLPDVADSTLPHLIARHVFTVALAPTYHRTGFFNVGVADQHWLGGDGDTIEMFLGTAENPVTGTINRRANGNGTPRVMGGTAARDWFAKEGHPGDVLRVEVYSPHSTRLHVVR
jgi:hypothetical protein